MIQLSRTVYKEPFVLPKSVQSLFHKEESSGKEELLEKYICDSIKTKKIAAFQFKSLCADTQVQNMARKMLLRQFESSEVRTFFVSVKLHIYKKDNIIVL